MGRYRAIFDKGGLLAEYVDGECVYVREDYSPPERSELASPGLIRDHIEPFQSMADGKLYDSKSAYRRTLKEKGLVELGNDAPLKSTPKPVKDTRRETLHRQLADVSDREANKLIKGLKKELRL